MVGDPFSACWHVPYYDKEQLVREVPCHSVSCWDAGMLLYLSTWLLSMHTPLCPMMIQMFNPALESFRKFINRAGTAGFTATLLAAGTIIPGAPVLDPSAAAGVSYTPAVEELLLKYFADFCKHQFG